MLDRIMWPQTWRIPLRRKNQEDAYIDSEKGHDVCYETKNPISSVRTIGSSSSRHTKLQGSNWMSFVDGQTLISALSIPGTHDSAAFRRSWPFVQTQDMTIEAQLQAGIRYFDLRCGVRSDIVEMVHGISVLGITLDTILQTMYAWLASAPSEALIVQIKEDRGPEASALPFAQAIANCIGQNPTRWRTDETTPSLTELRGRIQLLRRYTTTSTAVGIDLTAWPNNPPAPFTITTGQNILTIQDHYTFPRTETLPTLILKKGSDVVTMLEQTLSNPDPNHWFLNFTSTYEFNLFHQITPWQVAVGGYWNFHWQDGINSRIAMALGTGVGEQRLGILIMDFPDKGVEGLIETVFRSNFGYRRDTSRMGWGWVVLFVFVSLAVLSFNNII
ncbi:PLC-like phosphodiesterase [Acrodontium crateriforme]|uniref:PLC-like phosphodiesterase n=1 Tax=Acrodontium crateriforme TaxID=150365 RepID=A0AAQ3M6I3_9PEZI|nr:PLC-like phosphodiesterase [Acrodontium crateriforme]